MALRYGDFGVMALMAALTSCLHQIQGFSNKTLRPLVATLTGSPQTSSRMSYDLWRLRTNGLIKRIQRTHTYVLTPKGIRVATLYTKSYRRIVDPLFAQATATIPRSTDPQLSAAFHTIDRAINELANEAGIAA